TRAAEGAPLTVHGGESGGVAGGAGTGQAELPEATAGIRAPLRGRVWLDENDTPRCGGRAVRERGLAFIPEDRLRQGLVPPFSVVENAVLTSYPRPPISSGGVLRRAAARARAQRPVRAFPVPPAPPT